MAVEDHPNFKLWRQALDHMSKAEERYFRVVVTKQPDGKKKMALDDLHKARAAYLALAGSIE